MSRVVIEFIEIVSDDNDHLISGWVEVVRFDQVKKVVQSYLDLDDRYAKAHNVNTSVFARVVDPKIETDKFLDAINGE